MELLLRRQIGCERTAQHIQDSTDLVVGAASDIGSLSSGKLMASTDCSAANAIGIGVALVVLVVAVISTWQGVMPLPAA